MRTADTDPRPVLVLGATGKTGRHVTELLTAQGHPVRPASRSSATRFDWEDPATWAPALHGTRAAYIVPPEEPSADLTPFLTAAQEAGLERLVLLSARHPEHGDPLLPANEDLLSSGPIPTTILQPAWFVQNFTEGIFVPELGGGVLRLPVGEGREPFIDTRDIAETAVAALTDPRHEGRTYELAGPEAITFAQMVERVGRATGRTLRFEPVTAQEWAAQVDDVLPPPVIELLIGLFAAIARGENDHPSPGMQEALGREARTVEAALGTV